jgi:nucleoside 2-deoxyribosyltransferase
MEAIRRADYLVAVLDGRAIDEGVAFEIGVAFSHTKRCVGLQTDSRRLASWGNNPMITGALAIVFQRVEDLLSWVAREVSSSQDADEVSEDAKSRPLPVPQA